MSHLATATVALLVLLSASTGTAAAATATKTFSTPGAHTFTVPPATTSIAVVATGGDGGGASPAGNGGKGAVVTGTLTVTPGQVLEVAVGGNGGYDGAPGFNGGGDRGAEVNWTNGSRHPGGGGGGGASDVRSCPRTATSCGDTLASRLIVAAGGGGAGGNAQGGGSHGGDAGQPGTGDACQNEGRAGQAGTASAGGAGGAGFDGGGTADDGAAGTAGSGGKGGEGTAYGGGGGGGGGLYGGGGGGNGFCGGGGGGGSNLVPAGGTAGLATTGGPKVTLTYDVGTPTTLALAFPDDEVVANGTDETTVVATVTDAQGRGVPGENVAISTTNGNTFEDYTDHGDGRYTATVIATTVAGDGTFEARSDSTPSIPHATAVLHQVAGPASSIDVVLADADLDAGSSETTTATATVTDAHGNPVSGDTVAFTSSPADGPVPGPTSAGATPGTYVSTVAASSRPGTYAIIATDVTTGVADWATLTQRDVDDPQITITRPVSGATYAQGAAVRAAYSCSDGDGLGIESCTGTVPLGVRIDTSRPGARSFTVTAVDKEGNTATSTVRYTVLAAKNDSAGGGGTQTATTPAAPPPPQPEPAADGPAVVPPAAAVAIARGGRARLRGRRLTTGLSATCPATAAAQCAGTVSVRAGGRALGRARFAVAAGRRRGLALTLSKANARRARRARRITVKLVLAEPGRPAVTRSFSVKLG